MHSKTVLVLLTAAMALLGCDDSTKVKTTQVVENNIVLKRGDGSVVSIGEDLAVCCGEWEAGAGVFPFKVFFYDSELLLDNGFLKMFLVPSEITLGQPVSLPTPEGRSTKIFVGDAATENEANSDVLGSSGSFTVTEFDCGPPMILNVQFDNVILGSEFGGVDPLSMTGTLVIRADANLSEFGCDFGI